MSTKPFVIFSFVALLALVYFGQSSSTEQAANSTEKSTSVAVKILNRISAVGSDPSEAKTQYEAKLSQVLEEIPTLSQKSPPQVDGDGEVHGFVPEVFAEARKLAELRKLSLEHEELIPSTQATYAECAERANLSDSVRAICFMRALELSIKLQNPQYIVGLNVPANVRELALKLNN